MREKIETIMTILSKKERKAVIRSAGEFLKRFEDLVNVPLYECGMLDDDPTAPMEFTIESQPIQENYIGKWVHITYVREQFTMRHYLRDFFWGGQYFVIRNKDLAERIYRLSLDKTCLVYETKWKEKMHHEVSKLRKDIVF